MLHVPLGAVGCWWVRTGAPWDLWALGTHGDVVPPGVGAGPSWEGGKWSRTTSQPREGPPGVRGTPGRQPVGSGQLRGVPLQGHAGWPGNPFVPVTRLPSQSPGAARNVRGGRGSCPLPKASMWGSGVGVLARADPVRTGTHAGTQQEEVGAASTPGWAALGIWDQAQLPPRAPPRSPPGVPIPPALLSHFIPVQHWGLLVGTWCCPSPALAPWGPACQGWPMGATTPGDVHAGTGPHEAPFPRTPPAPRGARVLVGSSLHPRGPRMWDTTRKAPCPGFGPPQYPEPSHGEAPAPL